MTRSDGLIGVGIKAFQTYILYKLSQQTMIKMWPYFFRIYNIVFEPNLMVFLHLVCVVGEGGFIIKQNVVGAKLMKVKDSYNFGCKSSGISTGLHTGTKPETWASYISRKSLRHSLLTCLDIENFLQIVILSLFNYFRQNISMGK